MRILLSLLCKPGPVIQLLIISDCVPNFSVQVAKHTRPVIVRLCLLLFALTHCTRAPATVNFSLFLKYNDAYFLPSCLCLYYSFASNTFSALSDLKDFHSSFKILLIYHLPCEITPDSPGHGQLLALLWFPHFVHAFILILYLAVFSVSFSSLVIIKG